MGGLVHPQVVGIYFLTLLVLEFEKKLGVYRKHEVGAICC
jgi:hypothetical protein